MVKEVISEYDFIQADEHKSNLLMNVLDMELLEAEMTSNVAKEWDQRKFVRILSIQLSSLDDLF